MCLNQKEINISQTVPLLFPSPLPSLPQVFSSVRLVQNLKAKILYTQSKKRMQAMEQNLLISVHGAATRSNLVGTP